MTANLPVVAILISMERTEYTAVLRSIPKTGIDYWFGHKNRNPNEPFHKAGRLEVSGIMEESSNSAAPTRYKVKIGQKQWWANCAWDTLGIAAALHSDATIEAGYPDSDETIELRVENGAVDGKGNGVYFALPCRQWYEDLVFT